MDVIRHRHFEVEDQSLLRIESWRSTEFDPEGPVAAATNLFETKKMRYRLERKGREIRK
jgi:hypothetical protein